LKANYLAPFIKMDEDYLLKYQNSQLEGWLESPLHSPPQGGGNESARLVSLPNLCATDRT